ncbi:FAD binding domain-containing protein [Chloroflexota bacterium]
MWDEFIIAYSVEDVIQYLSEKRDRIRIIAGATDLLLEIERGLHPNIDAVVDISRISELDRISIDEEDIIHIGPLVTHNHCISSNIIRSRAYPLARACWEVGAPQIRNRGTIAGNLITASPANDTITPLIALGANVKLQSAERERTIPLSELYLGVRKTVMKADEMMVDISFPALRENQRGSFKKMALRRAQAISVVNIAVVLSIQDDIIQDAKITMGAVAPTIIHAIEAEKFLNGKSIHESDINSQAAEIAKNESKPIDDLRASANFRKEMVRIMTKRLLTNLLSNGVLDDIPNQPVFLWGSEEREERKEIDLRVLNQLSTINTIINGKEHSFSGIHKKSLLRMLREDADLIGTKEGCAEGECGACTIFLDGKAVMACLVPAARADNAEIITVEGLSNGDDIHRVQEAFIQEGAVQCGYCTPGFIMSAVKLLEEYPKPTKNQIQQALTGNLCRCTGYYKIVSAIEKAN